MLLPDRYQPDPAARVVYVLPVEAGFERQYGYGLGELAGMDVHNRYGLICVQPGFAQEPWYGDHETNREVRQESYIRDFVVPWVEDRFGVARTPHNRLLFGFSKSGWGACSLILRNENFFGAAAAWDAPLMLDRLCFRMADVFGTQENLDQYRPDLLALKKKELFRAAPRLLLAGERVWGAHIKAFHTLLVRETISHLYLDPIYAPHRWDIRWMEPLFAAFLHGIS